MTSAKKIITFMAAAAISLLMAIYLSSCKPTSMTQNSAAKSIVENIATEEILPECVSETSIVEVRGTSLSGIVEPGENLKLLIGYYKCMPVEMGDIVAYNFTGNPVPVVKIVKAVSGDRFRLQRNDSCTTIFVNEVIMKNSYGIPYCLDGQAYRLLSLYEKDYRGFIPKDAYLLLGNLPGGSTDSSWFGLVDKGDFVGKAVMTK